VARTRRNGALFRFRNSIKKQRTAGKTAGSSCAVIGLQDAAPTKKPGNDIPGLINKEYFLYFHYNTD
jgi:hypothetical protein